MKINGLNQANKNTMYLSIFLSFYKSIYHLRCSCTGTSVTKLSDYASDDEGDFITYSLDTVGQSYCTIDPVNGLITTSQVLDREVCYPCFLFTSDSDSISRSFCFKDLGVSSLAFVVLFFVVFIFFLERRM